MPEGWVKIYSPTGYVYLTKDGPQLQRIGFERAPLDNAFPRLRKREQHKITADIDLITLSERYVANIKSGSLENIEILSAGQSQLDGRPAFEKLMQYTDSSGVRYRVKAYGLVNENGFYEVYYSAPVLYFYDRDIITFEEVLATYQIIIETDDKVSN
ncbi:MAG: hypothetical protein HKM24_05520 [Gammaproteobacteria bacterium]|nr:hypothetical protein [Gammaproteobacteria bacterium]